MKKKLFFIFSLVIILCVGILICILKNTNDVCEESTIKDFKKNENMLSMMLETEAESGNYEMTTRDSWPTSGYKFNSILSKCENGGEISWDDENKRVLMSGNASDKCYVYFDLIVKTQININDTLLEKLSEKSSYDFDTCWSGSGYELTNNVITIGKNYKVNYFDLFEYINANHSDTIFFDSNTYFLTINAINLPDNYCEVTDTLCLSSNITDLNFTTKYFYEPYNYGIGLGSDYGYISNMYYNGQNLMVKRSSAAQAFAIQFIEEGKIPSDWYKIFLCGPCLSENTEVYVYDKKKKKFKKKKIGDIDFDDEILCWDFDKSEFAIAKPIWIKKCEQSNNYNLLKFSDGSTLETINQHRIFNVEKGMFTYPMSDDTPIGTTTFNSKGEYVKLVSKEVIEKPIDYFNIMTEYHINLFANDILTSCRLSNMYKVKNMKYECNKKRNNGYDLSKYNEKLVNGLRLREQDIEEGKLKKYVDNMLRIKK